MSRSTPAVDKAATFLRQLVEYNREGGRSRLPVVAELARDAGVSQASMVKAIRRLCDEGILVTSHGRGTRIVSHQEPPPIEDAPGTRRGRQLCALRLERDVRSGRFGFAGVLPSLKELCERYGVCGRTMRRSLATLVNRGVVEPYRRRYRLPVARAEKNRNTIVLIARGEPSGRSLLLTTARTEEHLRSLERECARRDVVLCPVLCNRFGRSLDDLNRETHQLPRTMNLDTVLGFMIWSDAIDAEPLEHILHGLLHYGKPMSLLDDEGIAAGRSVVRGLARRGMHVFTCQRFPGEAVGRHLLSLGHRRIAYLTPAPDAVWSRMRRQGLEAVCDAAGLDNAVRQWGPESRTVHTPLLGDAFELSGRLNTALPRKLRVPSVPFPELSEPHARFVHDLRAYMSSRELSEKMLAVFEQALRDNTPTAWVCASDAAALAALDYLRNRNVEVPEELSLIGFDDSSDASAARLSSYNFGGAAAIAQMVDGLLRGESRQARRKPTETVGFVNGRGTAAPPGRLG